MTKLIILDKDGTLVRSISGAKYPSFHDQCLIPGVKERIYSHVEAADILAIASNQGGISKGHKSLDEAIAEFMEVFGLLPQIKVGCFCPDYEGKILHRIGSDGTLDTLKRENFPNFSSFRKPEPGMLQYLMSLFKGMYSGVLFVGDMESDEQAAAVAEVEYLDVEDWLKS
jgi:D-glycero-D-manno-heptose 1,7-bisphosphate phosphatase